MAVTLARWTIEQYHQMIAAGVLDDCAVELLEGEIVEMPPEGEPHAYYSHETRSYLERLLGDRVIVRDGKPITIPSSRSEPEPDVAIVQPLGREYLQHHPYPENIFWVIEFSNTSLKKDLETKSKIYAAAGIAEYWVANPQQMELVVFRDPVNGEYQFQQILTQGSIQSIAFPEISISIEQILL